MKRKYWIPVLFLVILIGGGYLFLRFNPPLEIGTRAMADDEKSAVVGVGNKGFGDITLSAVSVNHHEKPAETKLQVSNMLQGFIITDDFHNEEAQRYGFTQPDNAEIKTGTSPSSNFKKSDKGTASEKDEVYGVSVIHNEQINEVDIQYNYFGIPLQKTVSFS